MLARSVQSQYSQSVLDSEIIQVQQRWLKFSNRLKNKPKFICAQLSVIVFAVVVIDTDVDADDATDSNAATFASVATFPTFATSATFDTFDTFATFATLATFDTFDTFATFDTFDTFASFYDGNNDICSHIHWTWFCLRFPKIYDTLAF